MHVMNVALVIMSLTWMIASLVYFNKQAADIAMIIPFAVNVYLAVVLAREWKRKRFSSVFDSVSARLFFIHLILWMTLPTIILGKTM